MLVFGLSYAWGSDLPYELAFVKPLPTEFEIPYVLESVIRFVTEFLMAYVLVSDSQYVWEFETRFDSVFEMAFD